MVPLQNAIPAVVAALLKTGPISDEKLAFAWKAVVGPTLARATTPRLGPRGVVQVSANDERWRGEVRRSATVILSRLQELVGRSVVTRVDVLRTSAPSRAQNPASRQNP